MVVIGEVILLYNELHSLSLSLFHSSQLPEQTRPKGRSAIDKIELGEVVEGDLIYVCGPYPRYLGRGSFAHPSTLLL